MRVEVFVSISLWFYILCRPDQSRFVLKWCTNHVSLMFMVEHIIVYMCEQAFSVDI